MVLFNVTKVATMKKVMINNTDSRAVLEATAPAAMVIAQGLTRRPQAIRETDEFVSKAGPELRSFHAGNEHGFKRGHDAGFGQGVAAGVFGVLLLFAGVAIAGSRGR